LAVLVLNARLEILKGHNKESKQAHLEGEMGSLAASLDYAISKKPIWLLDMFGINSDGKAKIRPLIQI